MEWNQKRKHVTIAGVRAIVTAAVAEMAMGIDTKKNQLTGSNKIKFINYSPSMKEFNAIQIGRAHV